MLNFYFYFNLKNSLLSLKFLVVYFTNVLFHFHVNCNQLIIVFFLFLIIINIIVLGAFFCWSDVYVNTETACACKANIDFYFFLIRHAVISVYSVCFIWEDLLLGEDNCVFKLWWIFSKEKVVMSGWTIGFVQLSLRIHFFYLKTSKESIKKISLLFLRNIIYGHWKSKLDDFCS